MMGIFDFFDHEDAGAHYNNIYYAEPVKHHASWSHEAIAGAAGFAAMRAYESHLRATGQNPSHSLMKEILAGIAMAEVEKLVETKGLDWIDAQKAKHMAKEQAHHLAEQRYGHGQTGYEYALEQRGPTFEYNFNGGVPYGMPGCPSIGYRGEDGGEYNRGYAPSYAPPPQSYGGGYPGGEYSGGYPERGLPHHGLHGRGHLGRGHLGRGFLGRE